MNRRLVSASCALVIVFLAFQESALADDVDCIRDPKTNRVFLIKAEDKLSDARISDPIQAAEKFIAEHGGAIGVTDPKTQLVLVSQTVDRLGMTHLRYYQSYNKVPVFGAQLLVHLTKENQVASINGTTIDKLKINVVPKLVAGTAATKAKAYLSKQGLTEGVTLVATKLYIFNKGLLEGNLPSDASQLAWEVKLKRVTSGITENLYLDANNGALLYQENDLREINRQIYDCSQNNNCLLDSYSETYDYWFGRSESEPARGPNPLNGRNDVDILFDLTGHAHQYWQTMFERDGANNRGGLGNGSSIPWEITRFDAYVNNTCPWGGYTGDKIWLCPGMATADVVGHEYTHGVVRNSIFDAAGGAIGLSRQGDPGALNEAYAETFGEMLEYALTGDNDWISGGELTEPNVSRISLSNPNYYMLSYRPYAARTYDPYFYCGGVNTLYIYLNSTVLSHASYLASMGSGPEGFNGCTIEAIGREKVARIWYRALTMYFTYTETFTAAYQALVQSCEDLYPDPTDPTCWHLTKALRSVQLDQAGLCSGIPEQAPVCDLCPDDENKELPGECGCGVADTDTDEDGTADCLDGCVNDPAKTAPGTCGCGVPDVDTDADGVMDCVDGCPTDRTKTSPGVCGCGVADTDTDGDGTADCNDLCPADPGKTAPGVCGCGVADTDSDGDGTPNCNDQCPNDPTKIVPGACGCGMPEPGPDSDRDGYPAYNACNGINDCNDNDASINPGHTEVCGDGKDNNCSGQIDENCSTVCNDSDNGLNWYTAGTVTANGHTYKDSCIFGLFVVENYCLLKRFPAEAFMICIKGCTAGACRR